MSTNSHIMVERGRLSYTAYSQTPDDGKRYEFLGGEVYVSPTPSFPHQHTSGELNAQLRSYLKGPAQAGHVYAAPLAVILSDDPPADAEICVPDLVILRDMSSASKRGVEGPPFVAVEIISPSRPWLDRKVKFERYAANGIPHYWIVDPIGEVLECFRLVDGHYVVDAMGTANARLAVPAFPGLVIDLGQLWLRLPAKE
jgi:Uma2 family endonuclease